MVSVPEIKNTLATSLSTVFYFLGMKSNNVAVDPILADRPIIVFLKRHFVRLFFLKTIWAIDSPNHILIAQNIFLHMGNRLKPIIFVFRRFGVGLSIVQNVSNDSTKQQHWTIVQNASWGKLLMTQKGKTTLGDRRKFGKLQLYWILTILSQKSPK